MPDLESPAFDRLRRIARIARYATVIFLLVMFTATHIPIPVSAITYHVGSLDKVVHCLIYLMLTFSALTSLELSIGLLRPQHYFSIWLIGTLYGAFDEATQIPFGRKCDPMDWLSDIFGIVLGLILFRLLRPLLYRLVTVKVPVN